MRKKDLLILVVFAVLGYVLRVMFLPQGALTFGYDQARDAFTTQEIIGGDLKILGPPASTPGLYHGVFYYYFLILPYLISWNPVVAALWTAFFNTLTIFIVYYLAFFFTKRRSAALVSSFLFAISFEAIQYSIWLSNPTLGVWTVPLIYLGLWVWIKYRRRWAPFVTAIGLGLSIQSEVFLLYHIVPVLLWLWVSRRNISMRQGVQFAFILLLTLSTMILAEVKFGFRGISGVLTLLAREESIRGAKSLGDFLLLFFNQIGRVFALSTYPGNIGYGSVFVLILLVVALYEWDKKKISWQPFLASWLLSHITVVSMGGTSTPFLLVGIGPAVSILVGIYISKWWVEGRKSVATFLLIFLIYGNISMIFRENRSGQTIFSIQKDMLLKNELPTIDYTYAEAHGKPFSINTLTSPLWINTTWSYLYNHYGVDKYGYLPEWHGRDQIGRLGNNLENTSEETLVYFLILEPLQGIPPTYYNETLQSENAASKLVEEKNFAEVIVQEREKID